MLKVTEEAGCGFDRMCYNHRTRPDVMWQPFCRAHHNDANPRKDPVLYNLSLT